MSRIEKTTLVVLVIGFLAYGYFGHQAKIAQDAEETELIQTLVQESVDTAIVAERNRIMKEMIDRDLATLWPEMRDVILPSE